MATLIPQDEPSATPEWASDPPAAPPTTITEPLIATKEAGWQPGKLRREYLNWWQNLVWQWIEWFAAKVFRYSMLGPDQAVPGFGSAPTVAASLISAAANFSAWVITGSGYSTGLVSSPAFVYTASKDTYWDLSRAGTWTGVVVNNGAGAPALTANSVRCFKVVTDGTGRTAVTDLRNTSLRLSQTLNFDALTLGDSLLASAANMALNRLTVRYARTVDTGAYTNVAHFVDTTGTHPIAVNLYIRHSTRNLCLVKSATWNGTLWTADDGAPTFVELGPQPNTYSIPSPGAGVTFSDSAWFAAETAGGVNKSMTFNGRVIAGQDLTNSTHENKTPRFQAVAGDAASRTWMADFNALEIFGIPGAAIGTQSSGRGGELCSNCFYNNDTAVWTRSNSGSDCYKLDIAKFGLALYVHASGDASTWADTVAAGTWTLLASIGLGGYIFNGGITINSGGITAAGTLATTGALSVDMTGTVSGDFTAGADLAVSGDTTLAGSVTAPFLSLTDSGASPVADRLYSSNIVKAWGYFTTNAGGSFTVNRGFNLSAVSIVDDGGGQNVIQIDFVVPFDNTGFMAIATSHDITISANATVKINSASRIQIKLFNGAGSYVDVAGSPVQKISFMAIGFQ